MAELVWIFREERDIIDKKVYTRCTVWEETMVIRDVVKRTGLQKRTIYYYIDKKLLEPAVDPRNGYHNFSEEDVTRLSVIRKLREAGLPIADIRRILANPRTMTYYLHKQLKQLQIQLLITEETIKSLDQFAADLPACHSLKDISAQLEKAEFKPDISKYQVQFESGDARLIAGYLWQYYLEAPMADYRQFLWQKVMQYTKEHTHSDLKVMSGYLEFLPPEKLDEASVSQYLRNRKIIGLTPETYPVFIEEMKDELRRFASDPVQKEQWSLLYEPVIRPATLFAYGANHWMTEFHPDYEKYYNNIHACCLALRDELADGRKTELAELRDQLEQIFGKSCDLETSSYGELEIAASFSQSVYAQLPPEEIRKFLETEK